MLVLASYISRKVYRIRPIYHTVRLSFSKLLEN